MTGPAPKKQKQDSRILTWILPAIVLLFSLPAGAVFLYSTSDNPLGPALGLLSTLMLVLGIVRLQARIHRKAIRRLFTVSALLSLTVFLYVWLLSHYFQGEGFNSRFLYHFNVATAIQGWQSYPGLYLLFFLWSTLTVGLALLLPADLPRRLDGRVVPLLMLGLLLNPEVARQLALEGRSLVLERPPSLSSVEWERLGLNEGALDRGSSALAGKNLVLIYLEGLEAIYTDDSLFPGLTPHINRLALQGLRHRNLQQVQGSGWTIGGLVSSLCGTPLVHELGLSGNNIMFSRFLNNADCLSDVLARAGYQQTFLGGASLDFAGKGRFFTSHGFDRVLGLEELRDRLEDPGYLNGWGLYDDSLFELAVQEYRRLAAAGSPFNLTMLTLDTHHPTGHASASCPDYPAIDNSILHAVHCSDYLLGQFIDAIAEEPAFANTVVAVTSDHLSMRNNAYPLFPRHYPRRNLFFLLDGNEQGEWSAEAAPMDIAPTLLSRLGVDHDSAFLAGSDMGEAGSTGSALNLHSRQRARTLAHLNTRWLSTGLEEGELVYDLGETTPEHIEFQHQIGNLRLGEHGLSLDATGTDPYFILSPIDVPEEGEVSIALTVDSEEDSALELFYGAEPGFSEDRKLRRTITPGRNHLMFRLPAHEARHLRIDPGRLPGTYRFSLLEVRAD